MTEHGIDGPYNVHISTPMPLAGHDNFSVPLPPPFCISTPMPLAGHDVLSLLLIPQNRTISTPMPLAGHDY